MTDIEGLLQADLDKGTDAVYGGDWVDSTGQPGRTLSADEFFNMISGVRMINNGLLLQLTLPDGSVGTYQFSEASTANKFL